MPDIKPILRKLDDQIDQTTSRDGVAPAVLKLTADEIAKFREQYSAPEGELVYRGVVIDDSIDAALRAYVDPDAIDATDAVTPRGFVPARASGLESGQLASSRADVFTDEKLDELARESEDNVYVSPTDVDKASKFSKAPDVGKLGDVKVQK